MNAEENLLKQELTQALSERDAALLQLSNLESVNADYIQVCRQRDEYIQKYSDTLLQIGELKAELERVTELGKGVHATMLELAREVQGKDRLLRAIGMVAHGEGLSDTARVIKIQGILHTPEKRICARSTGSDQGDFPCELERNHDGACGRKRKECP